MSIRLLTAAGLFALAGAALALLPWTARNLIQVDVATPLTRSTSMPDYRLQVFIESFEQDVDGSVQLVARWQISDGETSRALAIAEDRFERRGLAPGDHAAVVAAMRELYGELAEAIARSVLLQARQA